MTNGGYTFVMRGKGGSKTGWGTTSNLNVPANSTAIGGTFKFADATINAIPKTIYKLVADGTSFGGTIAYFSGSCIFSHLSQSNAPACTKSYSDATLTTTLRNQNTYYDSYNSGISDAQGGTNMTFFTYNTYSSTNAWGVGNGSSSCNGGSSGCDLIVWVK